MKPVLLDNLRAVAAMKRAPERAGGEANPAARADIVAEIEKHLRGAGCAYDVKEKGEFTYYEITDGGCLTGNHGGTGYGFQVFPSGAAVYHCHHDTCAGQTGVSAWDLIGVEKRPPVVPPSQAIGGLPGYSQVIDQLAELRKQQESAWMKGEKAPDLTERTDKLISRCAKLSKEEIEEVLDEIAKNEPLSKTSRSILKRAWQKAVKGAHILSGQAVAGVPERPKSWPYMVKNGRIVFLIEKTFFESITFQANPVCDFTAKIAQEITDEGGDRTFVIAGKGLRGGPYEMEIDAEDFGNDRRLKALLDAHVGAKDPVYARMSGHLAPAIKLLTREELKQIKRYKRTGWAGTQFLIPGREPPGVQIDLHRKLPYGVKRDADLDKGIAGFCALLDSMGPELSTLAASIVLEAPMARVADWTNERYCIFITGRTGSLKTSFAQMLMCIYGPRFSQDELLIKWGEGATRTAMIIMASRAHDMPLLIDNYKPNTGGGARDFVQLIHNIVEGGDKDRANRNAELRDTTPIFCWPLCTGEDVPNADPASLARILVVPFKWQRGYDNPDLTLAQKLSDHLCAIGREWIGWIETEQGQATIKRIAAKFPDRRSYWSEQLRGIRQDGANNLRVASNLATNELTWEMLCEHPTLGDVGARFREAHQTGLHNTASEMVMATAESLEGSKFVEALKELLTTGRAILLSREVPAQQNEADIIEEKHNRDRIIGWQDDDGVYMLSSTARQAVERLLGPESLSDLSSHALYRQLEELGHLVVTENSGQKCYTSTKRMRGKVKRVMHFAAGTFEERENESGEPDSADGGDEGGTNGGQKFDDIPF